MYRIVQGSVGGLTLLSLLLMPIQSSCAKSPAPLSLKIIERSASSGIVKPTLQFMAISDEPRFLAFYKKLHAINIPAPAPPPIDFERHHVLIAFMGQRSSAGYAISFDETPIKPAQDIEIKVLMQVPPTGAITAQVLTHPYVLATVARGAYRRVTFVDQDGKRLGQLKLE